MRQHLSFREHFRRGNASAATIGSATTVSFVIGAGLLPWIAGAIDRFGARAVLTGGVLLLGAGVIGISRVVGHGSSMRAI